MQLGDAANVRECRQRQIEKEGKRGKKREKEVIIARVNTRTLGGRRHHGAGFPVSPSSSSSSSSSSSEKPNEMPQCQIKKAPSDSS